MNAFSTAWLDLREPVDACARNAGLARRLVQHLPGDTDLHIVDLGCGIGANLRWLAPRLPRRQRWLLLDHDERLLSVLAQRLEAGNDATGGIARLAGGIEARWRAVDLACARVPSQGAHLVTASALVDLVSRSWLAALARACAAAGAALMLALCYDGRIALRPRHRLDGVVRDAVNRHQLRDKGFGPALGPGAAAAATAELGALGYGVVQSRSDWCLHPNHAELHDALLRGWHQAAREQLGERAWLDDWLDWRLARLDDGHARVGHVDLLALPPP